MYIKNQIEMLKTYCRRRFGKVSFGDTPNEDMKMLSALCAHSTTLKVGRRDRLYWYYFPLVSSDCDVIKYLFERNGVIPTFHHSRYCMPVGERCGSFRISYKYLTKHPYLFDFVEGVAPIWSKESRKDILDKIEELRTEKDMRRFVKTR